MQKLLIVKCLLSIKWPAIVLLEFHLFSLTICGANSPNDKKKRQASTRIRKNLKLNIEIADILQIWTLELYIRLGWMISLFSSRMPSSYKRKIICQTFSASLSWTSVHPYITIINKANNFRFSFLFIYLPPTSLCLSANITVDFFSLLLCSLLFLLLHCYNLRYWYVQCCHSHSRSVHILSDSNHFPHT